MTEPSTVICGRRVSAADPPFVVAELSANHGGDFDRALRIIDIAANAGVDAVKFQAYTADSLTIRSDRNDFTIKGNSLWSGRSLYELYQEAATPYEWFPELFAACKRRDVIPFASPFDREAVEMLEQLNAPTYKIASFEAIDLDLIAACSETGKPVIISVGLCSAEEIEDAISAVKTGGTSDVVLLQCTSVYPSKPDEADLITIPALKGLYGVPVGYSDHTMGTLTSVAACALGASVIEKHVIDYREPPTADSAFSLTGEDLSTLVNACRDAWASRGKVRNGPTDQELDSIGFRRSLFVTADIEKGQLLTSDNVRSIRPGLGLAPKFLPSVLGRRAGRDLKAGDPIQWSMLDPDTPV